MEELLKGTAPVYMIKMQWDLPKDKAMQGNRCEEEELQRMLIVYSQQIIIQFYHHHHHHCRYRSIGIYPK